MASRVFPKSLAKMLKGDLDLDGGDVYLQCVGPGYVPSDADEFLDPAVDPGDFIGDPVLLTGKTFLAGFLDADRPVTVTNPANLDNVTGVVSYLDIGGDPTLSPILHHEERRSNTLPIDYTSDGTDFSLNWSRGYLFSI